MDSQLLTFDVPFALKNEVERPGDGRDMVYSGKVTLRGPIMSVFEAGECESNGLPVLSFNLMSLDTIKPRKFKSESGTMVGGRVELVGFFDQPFKERITLKMELKEYRRLNEAFKALHQTLR